VPVTRRKTLVRWIAAGILAVVVSALVWWSYQTWSAKTAWEHYRREATARGVRMTFADFRAPEVAPEDNYADVSLFTSAVDTSEEAARPLKLPTVKISAKNPRSADILAAYRDAMIAGGWLPPRCREALQRKPC
jgi:hypothetical protein